MLVLERDPEESVVITVPPSTRERQIVVQVMRHYRRRGRARLGFTADNDVTIVRPDAVNKTPKQRTEAA